MMNYRGVGLAMLFHITPQFRMENLKQLNEPYPRQFIQREMSTEISLNSRADNVT